MQTLMAGLRVAGFVLALLVAQACGDSGAGPEVTRAERFQLVLDDHRTLHDLIGVSAAVIVPGEELWVGTSGESHPGTPLTPDMLLGIGSVTKTFTAALVLDLAEEGLLSLDDPILRWLPSIPHVDAAITIRHLLNHTSGVFDPFNDNPALWQAIAADPGAVWAHEDALGYLQAPRFARGTSWAYSNTNYVLLGMIIERATGSTVSSELRQRFRVPLGLGSTFLEVEEASPGPLAHSWSDWFDGDGILDDVSAVPRTALFGAIWTTGAMFSTAGDVARWMEALYEGEVIGQAYLDEMLTFHPVETAPWPGFTGYGLGAARGTYRGIELWGHAGSVPSVRLRSHWRSTRRVLG